MSDALKSAIKYRRPDPLLTFHSDRGVQYASGGVISVLAQAQHHPKHESQGGLLGQRIAKIFFGKFKTEHMFWESYETKDEARRKIFEWIEVDYNRKRLHSAIG